MKKKPTSNYYIKRKLRAIKEVMKIIRRAKESGKCAVCHKAPQMKYPDGSPSMTCSMRCQGIWLHGK